MKLYDTKPWPKSAVTHLIAISMLERWDFCILHSATTPLTRADEKNWREAFEAVAGEWADEWEQIASKGLDFERHAEVHHIKLTKANLRAMVAMFEAALKQRTQFGAAILNGNQARHVNEMIERCEWAKDSVAIDGATVKGKKPAPTPAPVPSGVKKIAAADPEPVGDDLDFEDDEEDEDEGD